ncbi:MAG TPA: tyrosine-type recombinase/integrase [Gammaproteobacteria bacterium]|nr:tyrosine-type recombinase/integrase [Gammaproteobacteria bacterium]
MRDLAGSPDLRFHDLRHEATTRLVTKARNNIALVASITGHRSLHTLKAYVPVDLTGKRALIDEIEGER